MKYHFVAAIGLVSGMFFLTSNAAGQITIQKADFQKIFSPGISLSFAIDTSRSVNVGKAGGPNIYDFSALTFTDTSTQTLYATTDVPFLASRFGSTGLFWSNAFPHTNGDPVLTFGTSTFESLGEVAITDTSQEVKYHVPHEIIGQFPFTYNQNWGTTGAGLGTDSLFVNGLLRRANSGYNSAETTFVDGYGTLLLLGKSHQCLRLRQVEVAQYVHKGFEYFTEDGIVLLIDSDKSQHDTGNVAVTGITVIAAPTVTSANEEYAAPGNFVLQQNYPNPFNPSTNVNFQLPIAVHARLDVFDVLGRRVTTLIDGRLNAGIHHAAFDGSKLASGVYFYRLQAGNFTSTKKLVLMK
ncbi:MAG TPA: T9SS type A sorting domain-containing protein [Terriglobia bacterium]|nr:T9SS type A sorting domain-containing protein [Terriglobia bacterium]